MSSAAFVYEKLPPFHPLRKKGYKYRLCQDYRIQIEPRVPPFIDVDNILFLSPDGWLVVKAGYAWDGSSGPTIDTPSNMRASLLHDVLFQLMRLGKLAYKKWIGYTNRLFRSMCLEDGMNPFRAWIYYLGVSSWFSRRHAKPKRK